MIYVYTTTSCESCRKTIDFMTVHNIPHIEKKMTYAGMTKSSFLKIIALTSDVKDVIASNHLKAHQENIEEMRLGQLYEWLSADKRRFKRPITVDFDRGLLHIGYHKEDLLVFMNKKQRNAYRKKMRFEDYKW